MKKSINIIILGICFLMIQSKATNVQSIPDTFVLQIEGKITNAQQDDALVTVELICNRVKIDSFTLKDRRSFTLHLKINTQYTIRISKTGCADKNISVNTNVNQYNNEAYSFAFETRLIDNQVAAKMNKDVLEMPIAMIYFEEKKNCFYYSKAYTSNIKRELALR